MQIEEVSMKSGYLCGKQEDHMPFELPQLLRLIQAYEAAHPFPDAPSALYEPCSYMLSLGGKRLRPAMVLMGCNLFDAGVEQALPVAWAVELFHNFTLMHDDIMDAAPLRRGQPTVHTKWNVTTGILSGDVMLIRAYQQLASFHRTSEMPRLLEIFNRVAVGVCEGQQMDINFERMDQVDSAVYLEMITLKTAVLLGGALEMGGICGGCTGSDARHLYELGRLAGIAFQLQDDYLDTFGDPEKFGKKIGGDILQQKKTYLMLNALELAKGQDLINLTQANEQNPEEKIARVTAIFEKLGVKENTRQMMQTFKDKALNDIERLKCNLSGKEMLNDLADLLMAREK